MAWFPAIYYQRDKKYPCLGKIRLKIKLLFSILDIHWKSSMINSCFVTLFVSSHLKNGPLNIKGFKWHPLNVYFYWMKLNWAKPSACLVHFLCFAKLVYYLEQDLSARRYSSVLGISTAKNEPFSWVFWNLFSIQFSGSDQDCSTQIAALVQQDVLAKKYFAKHKTHIYRLSFMFVII